MGLVIQARGRLRRPRRFRFDDDVERIVIGRDPDRCQVLFAARLRRVGLEHCALERVLGRYRLVLNGTDAVYVDGEPALDGDEIPDRCELRLGRRGPRLRVYASTPENGPGVPPRSPLKRALSAMRVNRFAIWTTLLATMLGLVGGAWALHRGSRIPTPTTPDDEALVAALRAAVDSVYRTIHVDENGHEHPGATAWVVGPRQLATNAHVAEHFRHLAGDARMLVRSPGRRPRTHEVVAVRLHPGYEAFDQLWAAFEPTCGSHPTHPRRVRSPGRGCDVALLTVAEGSALGSPLPLADTDTCYALAPGQLVGSIGYPAEGLVLDGSPVTHPVPHVQTGRITSVTTYFGQRGEDHENHLVQHSVPGVGGSSGSPLFNTRGEVVAMHSAGNYAFGWGSRIPLAVGVDFAQRIDLLQELVDGSAEGLLPVRIDAWRRTLRSLYASGTRQARDRERDSILRRAAARFEKKGRYQQAYGFERIHRSVLVADVYRPPLAIETRIPIPEAGSYLLLLWPHGRFEHDQEIHFEGAGGRARRLVPARDAYDRTRVATLHAAEAGQLRIGVLARREPARVGIELYVSSTAPLGQEGLVERVADAFCTQLSASLDGAYTCDLVEHLSGTIEQSPREYDTWRSRPQHLEPGLYLLLAVAASDERIGVYTLGGSSRFRHAATEPDGVAACVTYVARGRRLEVTVMGPPNATADVHVDLHVYRARRKR